MEPANSITTAIRRNGGVAIENRSQVNFKDEPMLESTPNSSESTRVFLIAAQMFNPCLCSGTERWL
jgi:hypothetical protein